MGVSFALLSVAPSWERGAGEMQGTDCLVEYPGTGG